MSRTRAATAAVERPSSRASASEEATVPVVLLRAWLGRVEEALLRGVRLRIAGQAQATTQLGILADELDSVAEQIRCALGIRAKLPIR